MKISLEAERGCLEKKAPTTVSKPRAEVADKPPLLVDFHVCLMPSAARADSWVNPYDQFRFFVALMNVNNHRSYESRDLQREEGVEVESSLM